MLRGLSVFVRAGEQQQGSLLAGVISSLRAQQLASVSTSSSADAAAQAAPVAGTKPVLMKEFQVYRWDPDTADAKPKYVSYKIDINR
jgi:succinate dehydrogenase (ubiquinone) iron-sulfur subunit